MGDLESILGELNHSAENGQSARRAALCHQALALISREAQPELWAKLQDEFGNNLARITAG
jgi:hypothetical protein